MATRIKKQHAPAARTPRPPPRRGRGLERDVWKSVTFSAIIVLVVVALEHTSAGDHVERFGYNLLQSRLHSNEIPVTVVDISSIATRPDVAIPRGTIQEAIDAIADQTPRAIGVDVDFSPDELGYKQPDDPAFFDACLGIEARQGVPIFLGIARTVLKPPREWLGNQKYQSLAANVFVPIDSRRMVHAVAISNNHKATTSTSVRSLSAALASAYDARTVNASGSRSMMMRLEQWNLLENISTTLLDQGLSVREFWVDYSPIAEIQKEAIDTTNPAVLRDRSNRKKLEDRVVILGDLTTPQPADLFPVLGKEYAGVLLHACAVNSLITSPLYVVTPRGRLVIDIFCVLLVLASITVIRWMYERPAHPRVAVARLQTLLMILVLLAPLAAGVAFVRSTRILWNDFILTAGTLLLHPSLEHHLAKSWNRTRGFFRRAFLRVAFEKPVER